MYVPTPQEVVDAMLRMPTSPRRTWSTTSARATDASRYRGADVRRDRVGIELEPGPDQGSERDSPRAGVGDKVRFLNQDLFETDPARATVITLYLLREMNLKLMPKLKELKPVRGSWCTASAWISCRRQMEQVSAKSIF